MALAERPSLQAALAQYNIGAAAQFVPASQRPLVCDVLEALQAKDSGLVLSVDKAVLVYRAAEGPPESEHVQTVLLEPRPGTETLIAADGRFELVRASDRQARLSGEYSLQEFVDTEAARLKLGGSGTYAADVRLFGRLDEASAAAAGLPSGKMTLYFQLSGDKSIRLLAAQLMCSWQEHMGVYDAPYKVAADFLQVPALVLAPAPQAPSVSPAFDAAVKKAEHGLPPEHFVAFFTPTSVLYTNNRYTRPRVKLGRATCFFTAPAVMNYVMGGAGGRSALYDPQVLQALLKKSGAGAIADALREVATQNKIAMICVADLLLEISGLDYEFNAERLVELVMTPDVASKSDVHTDLMLAIAQTIRASAKDVQRPGVIRDQSLFSYSLLTYIFEGWHRNTYVPQFLTELGFANFDTGMLDEQGNPNLRGIGFGLEVDPAELLRVLTRRDLFEAGAASAYTLFASVRPVVGIVNGVSAVSFGRCISIRDEGQSPLTFCYGQVGVSDPSYFCIISLDPRTQTGGIACGYGALPPREQMLARLMQNVLDTLLPSDAPPVELAPLPPPYRVMNEYRRYVEEALKSASVLDAPNPVLKAEVMQEDFVPVVGEGPALSVGFGPTAPGMQMRHTLSLQDKAKYNMVWLQRADGHGDWYAVDPLTRRASRVRIQKLEGGGTSITLISHDGHLYCRRSFRDRLAALFDKLSHHYHERLRHLASRIGHDDEDADSGAHPLGLMAMITDGSKTLEAMDTAPAHTSAGGWPRDLIHNHNALIMYQIYGARVPDSTALLAPHITAHMTYI